ncbi:MAG: hypothetical protein JW839_14615, partial [Candidatus Lokiarchaeota archaeon]|nr:hypothetical protein [Candidatus Lokiarchaeota archaeon]
GVFVSGDVAYVADADSGLQCISVANPASPSLLGTYNTPGDALGVFVSGDVAYVADGVYGLQCINVANPASPSLLGTYNTPGQARGVYVSGDVAYVADDTSGLQCINIANPASPSLLGTYDTPGTAYGVFVSGDIAYIADGSSGVQCIKVLIHPWDDSVPPTNPSSPCTQTAGTTTNGTWQNAVDDPAFTWSGAYDGNGTGVWGYYVYWGTSASGTSTTFQAASSYDPGAVASGTTYYLRVQTRDNADNVASWTTLYVFRYDSTAPSNPTSPCTQTAGSTTNGTWQNAVDDPAFTWGGASDAHSGLWGYYVYWGTNAAGTSTTFLTSTAYDPGAASSGTYYLRVQARDTVDNVAPWATLYEFRYDDTIPTNPTSCTQTAGTTTSGTWQGTVSDPAFTWSGASDAHSGVAGYYVYWGTNANGISNASQADTAYDPGAVASGTTHFLRVMARDSAGNNASSWVTLYEFRYDATASTGSGLDSDQIIQIVLIISCGAAIGVVGIALGHKRSAKREPRPESK